MAAELTLYTYQDAVEHILDLFAMSRNTRNQRQARRAVQYAYREIWNAHDWTYAYQRFSIATTAAYSTGTVTYDHTGGAEERLVTLTGGTFPADAALGSIIISDVHYDIQTRLSDTTLTLGVNSNPGADVAASAYTWYRDAYPLPVGARKITRLVDVSAVGSQVIYVPPDEFLVRNRGYVSIAWPWYYTITRDMSYTGSLAVRFGPPPSVARTYDVFGIFGDGKQIHTERYATGTVSTSSTTVTGSGTTFNAKMVGSVIRFGTAATIPTSAYGNVDNDDNPFEVQRLVTAVASTTSLTIDEALTTELSAVKFVISDLIDIEGEAMLTAFLRLAEAEMAILLNQTQNTIDRRRERARMAILDAKAADNRRSHASDTPTYWPYRLRDVAQSVLPDA